MRLKFILYEDDVNFNKMLSLLSYDDKAWIFCVMRFILYIRTSAKYHALVQELGFMSVMNINNNTDFSRYKQFTIDELSKRDLYITIVADIRILHMSKPTDAELIEKINDVKRVLN